MSAVADEARRSRATHEAPEDPPKLPAKGPAGEKLWTPLIVLGALAMVTSGEWWEVPEVGSGANAATFAWRCRKIGLDATSSYGRVFVRRPDEPREALTQSGTEVVRTDRFVGGQS